MTPGDVVTVAPPFGDGLTECVVSGVVDADTSMVWDGHEHSAYAHFHLTFIRAGGEYPSPNVAYQPRVIRDWEFRNRFTQTQLVGIMRAAMAGDDVAALVWLKLSTASDGVNLDEPETAAGVQYIANAYPALAVSPQEILK